MKIRDNLRANPWRWGTGLAILAYFSLALLLGLFRHWGYMSSLHDLGQFDQAVWGSLHGAWFLNTNNLFHIPINWLGFHFNPILLLFIPLYSWIPDAIWFAIAQALALSLAAWPIFLLASRFYQSEQMGFLWALAYLLNPFLLSAAAWDFHPITLAVPFVAMGFWAIEKRDAVLLSVACVMILTVQEHLGIMVLGFGLLWWLQSKRWKSAAALIALGAAHAILVLGVIMPALSPTGQHQMVSSELGQLSRYGWLGSSVSEILTTSLMHPVEVIKIVMLDLQGALYLFVLLMPFVGFPVAAPAFILPGLADLAANMLSANFMPRTLIAYHSVSLVPVLTVAAIYGARRLSFLVKRYSPKELTGFVMVASFAASYFLAPWPLPGAHNPWKPVHFVNGPDPTVQTVRSTVGTNASVSAQANIGPHFTQRQAIYIFPERLNKVDAVILRLETPTTKLHPPELGELATLAYHLKMPPARYLASIDCLLSNKKYKIALWKDPWLVFSKESPDLSLQKEVEQKIFQLMKEWQVSPEDYQAALKSCKAN